MEINSTTLVVLLCGMMILCAVIVVGALVALCVFFVRSTKAFQGLTERLLPSSEGVVRSADASLESEPKGEVLYRSDGSGLDSGGGVVRIGDAVSREAARAEQSERDREAENASILADVETLRSTLEEKRGA